MENQCDFCGSNKKTTIATIISQNALLNVKPQFTWQKKGQIALLFRCAKCKFFHILKPVFPMLLLIGAIWVLIGFGKLLFIPLAMLAMMVLYNPISKIMDKKFYTKKISKILIEKQLLDENDSMLVDKNCYIENDGIKSVFLMFPSTNNTKLIQFMNTALLCTVLQMTHAFIIIKPINQ